MNIWNAIKRAFTLPKNRNSLADIIGSLSDADKQKIVAEIEGGLEPILEKYAPGLAPILEPQLLSWLSDLLQIKIS